MPASCVLCQSACEQFFTDARRTYLQCSKCALVFADPQSWPTQSQEKAEYDLHENDVNDAGYNAFLARMVEPLSCRLPNQARVLDFGCGPAPALAEQLKALGYQVFLYDLFYYPDTQALNQTYDAIVMTEVIEHLHQPRPQLEQLWSQLNPGGVLGVMTQRVINKGRFLNWQYKNDPTHVCFYHENTFSWLAEVMGASEVAFEGRDMVFLTKPQTCKTSATTEK